MSYATVADLYDAAATAYGESVALVHGERRVTYDELRDAALRTAGGLSVLGIGKGDRVAFLMANCPEYVFCEYALTMLGAVRVPLAVALGEDHHVHMVNHSGAETIIYHSALAGRVASMASRLETVDRFVRIGGGDVPDGHVAYDDLEDAQPPQVTVDGDDLVGIYYTGGTTGVPKGVMLSHRAWVNSVLLEMLELGIGRGERFAYMTPLTHAAGVLLLPVLLRRGTAHIYEGFDPTVFLAETEARKLTGSMFVPTMIYALLDSPAIDDCDTSSLRTLLYGAAPIAPERLQQAIERFGPIFAQFYGQTEAPMMLTALHKDEHAVGDAVKRRRVFASCGRPTVTTRIRLIDGNGSEVPDGEVGEIVANAINIMDGYYKDPEKTAETIRDGWLHTGDMAVRDADGLLFIVDRAKDMIISGGFNVYPREVEDVLFEHAAVRRAAVIGVPDRKWGEAVKAIVVLADGAETSAEELAAWVRDRKGPIHTPKSVEFWDEIPLTNLGKVDKKQIRAPYWEGHDRAV